MRKISVSFWIGSVVFLIMGFYKMLAYKNYDISKYPSLAKKNINAYVGGDAYNYIINGTYTTAYFVLFGVLLLAGIMVEILIAIKDSQQRETQVEETVID